MNLKVEKVIDTTNGVTLNLRYWSGTTSFTIVPMDDFEVFMGQEFPRMVKAVPMPHLDCLVMFSS